MPKVETDPRQRESLPRAWPHALRKEFFLKKLKSLPRVLNWRLKGRNSPTKPVPCLIRPRAPPFPGSLPPPGSLRSPLRATLSHPSRSAARLPLPGAALALPRGGSPPGPSPAAVPRAAVAATPAIAGRPEEARRWDTLDLVVARVSGRDPAPSGSSPWPPATATQPNPRLLRVGFRFWFWLGVQT